MPVSQDDLRAEEKRKQRPLRPKRHSAGVSDDHAEDNPPRLRCLPRLYTKPEPPLNIQEKPLRIAAKAVPMVAESKIENELVSRGPIRLDSGF